MRKMSNVARPHTCQLVTCGYAVMVACAGAPCCGSWSHDTGGVRHKGCLTCRCARSTVQAQHMVHLPSASVTAPGFLLLTCRRAGLMTGTTHAVHCKLYCCNTVETPCNVSFDAQKCILDPTHYSTTGYMPGKHCYLCSMTSASLLVPACGLLLQLLPPLACYILLLCVTRKYPFWRASNAHPAGDAWVD